MQRYFSHICDGTDVQADWRSCTYGRVPNAIPREGPGVKSRMCSPYPQSDRKRRLNGAVCRNHRIKRVVPCRWLDGHVKEPHEMSMAWEPDRRSNFFFNPPAHLCAVTYMTEISLIVTLNSQFHLITQCHRHFAGFSNVPALHRHGSTLFIRWLRHTAPFSRLLCILLLNIIVISRSAIWVFGTLHLIHPLCETSRGWSYLRPFARDEY